MVYGPAMSLQLYHYLHLLGLIVVFLGYGSLLSGDGAKTALKWTGAGALVSLVSGFGMLAKMGLFTTMPTWAWIKLGLWLVIAGLPVLAKRRILTGPAVVVLGALVGAGLAWLGFFKPAF